MSTTSYKIIENNKLPNFFYRLFMINTVCISFEMYVNDYQQKIYEMNVYQLNIFGIYKTENLMLNDFTDNFEVGEQTYAKIISHILRFMYGISIKREEIIFKEIKKNEK